MSQIRRIQKHTDVGPFDFHLLAQFDAAHAVHLDIAQQKVDRALPPARA